MDNSLNNFFLTKSADLYYFKIKFPYLRQIIKILPNFFFFKCNNGIFRNMKNVYLK